MSVIREFRRPATFDELLLTLRLFLMDNCRDVELERIRNGRGGYRLVLELDTGRDVCVEVHPEGPKAG